MAVTVDSVASGGGGTFSTATAGTNLDTLWSHTVNSTDANTLAIVCVGYSVNSNTTTFTPTATWGGVTMSPLAGVVGGSGTSRNVNLVFFLYNPPIGESMVTVTTGTEGTRTCIQGSSVVYKGCSTTIPNYVYYNGGTTTSVTSYTNTGHRTVCCVSNGSAITAMNQTQIFSAGSSVAGSGDYYAIQDSAGPSGYPAQGTVSFSFTMTASNSNIIVFSIPPVEPKVATLIDDFTTADTAKWAGAVSSYGTNPVVTNGQLVTTVSNTGWEGLWTVGKSFYDLKSSSFVIELVQPPARTGANTTYMEIGLKSYYSISGAGHTVDWLYQNSGTPTIYGRDNTNGTVTTTAVTYNATTHRWLRIRESGGTVYWDTSPNGNTWTNRRSKAISWPLDSCWLYIDGSVSTASPVTAIVDNYNNPPVVTVNPGQFMVAAHLW